jgi:hypothetical protein
MERTQISLESPSNDSKKGPTRGQALSSVAFATSNGNSSDLILRGMYAYVCIYYVCIYIDTYMHIYINAVALAIYNGNSSDIIFRGMYVCIYIYIYHVCMYV